MRPASPIHGTAILQAAPDEVGIYQRVGFESFANVTQYKPQEKKT